MKLGLQSNPVAQSTPAYLHLSFTASHRSVSTYGCIYLQRDVRRHCVELVMEHCACQVPLGCSDPRQVLPHAMPRSFPWPCQLLQHQLRHHRSKCLTSGALLGAIKHHLSPSASPVPLLETPTVWPDGNCPAQPIFLPPSPLPQVFPLQPTFLLCHRRDAHSLPEAGTPPTCRTTSQRQIHGLNGSLSTGFIPLFLLASLFPHGLLFYLGAHDCI